MLSENLLYLSDLKGIYTPLFNLGSCAASFMIVSLVLMLYANLLYTSGWKLILTGKLGAGLVE